MFAALNFGQGMLVSKIIYLYIYICMYAWCMCLWVHMYMRVQVPVVAERIRSLLS